MISKTVLLFGLPLQLWLGIFSHVSVGFVEFGYKIIFPFISKTPLFSKQTSFKFLLVGEHTEQELQFSPQRKAILNIIYTILIQM